jgi:hypothetical protein
MFDSAINFHDYNKLLFEREFLKNFERLTSGINNEKLEEEVEENEIKEIEKKHSEYINRKERERQMKTKSDLNKCLRVLMEKTGLFE